MNTRVNKDKLTKKSGSKNKERGASLVEYAILVALIVLVAIAAIRSVGEQVSENFSTIASELDNSGGN